MGEASRRKRAVLEQMCEAAEEERDRLREALAERVPEIVENLKRGGGAAAAWAAAIEAERDRLREALEKIAARAGVYQVEGVPLVADSIGGIARAALTASSLQSLKEL